MKILKNKKEIDTINSSSESNNKLYIETYGCQMNVADSEVVVSLLKEHGFILTGNIKDAGLILINTCSVRENAEIRVRGRLDVFRQIKNKNKNLLIGVIGCMAERLKETLLEEEKIVDLVVGPDAYRDLPNLIRSAESGQKAVNVLLSIEETYADICPVRLDKNNVSAYVSIMRGCNNMCSYCVVPFTRGRERSRDPETITREVNELLSMGYKEVTLLGQNVNSYRWANNDNSITGFPQLVEMVAKIDPTLRVRFSTSHPKDLTDELLQTIARYKNLCKNIHLPVQSGSSEILKKMNRGYDREIYMDRIIAIRRILPGCTITTDIIAGFCGETEENHKDTLSLMKWAEYDFAYMFKYSERPDTYAEKKLKDDVPEDIKIKRLNEIIKLQSSLSAKSKKGDLGKEYEVLIEGLSKKSNNHFYGRTTYSKVIVFPRENANIGDYVNVKVTDCTSSTLKGTIIRADISQG